MKNDLMQWMETINSKRKPCYDLKPIYIETYFIRNMLAEICSGKIVIDVLPFQVFILLKTTNPPR